MLFDFYKTDTIRDMKLFCHYSSSIFAGISLLLGMYFFVTNSFPTIAFFAYVISTGGFFLTFASVTSFKKWLVVYKKDIIISLGLTIATVGLYLYRITEITPGMWGDEVGLGWMVEQLLHRNTFTPFLSYNLGHPTPLVYLAAIFILLMGRSILSLRMVSVLFGAGSVGIFYFLLRKYFNKFYSTIGGILLACSYVLIIVSRFAYEMSAGIFFLILSFTLLIFFYENPSPKKGVFLGLSLGLGLYTYLSFRSIVIVMILFALYSIYKKSQRKLLSILFFFTSLFIILFPLLSYSIHYPMDVNARIESLSVFEQGLPTSEVIKELESASFRTFTLFFLTPDPNPRQNPGGAIPFDISTSLLFFAGLIYILGKKTWLGMLIFSLVLATLLSEIVTLERIPEFHYYGLGHPNTLRISFIVPLVIFSVVWAIKMIADKIDNTSVQKFAVVIVVCFIAGINLSKYYNQQLTPWIYTTNFVVPLKIVSLLNSQKPQDVALSQSFYTSQHIHYFLDPTIKVSNIPSPLDCTFSNLTHTVSFIAAQDLQACSQSQLTALLQNPRVSVNTMANPWNTIDAVILVRSKYDGN